jgi:hypothetical protein
MKKSNLFILCLIIFSGCQLSNSKTENAMSSKVNIIFLHHSTGMNIWKGGTSRVAYKIFKKGDVQKWFSGFNKSHRTNYQIEEMDFPNNKDGYGWKNYPYDYYNIWIKNEGDKTFMNEPTLELLTKKYTVIIWKHCFPVADIMSDTGRGDLNSEEKRIENYKLQYGLLKEKMKSFPKTIFIVWTGAALTKECTTPEKAEKAKDFFRWVKEQWDEPGDNVFLWDFNELETENGLYLKDEYAASLTDSHPNKTFAAKVAPLMCQRIVDIVEGRGDISSITGQ